MKESGLFPGAQKPDLDRFAEGQFCRVRPWERTGQGGGYGEESEETKSSGAGNVPLGEGSRLLVPGIRQSLSLFHRELEFIDQARATVIDTFEQHSIRAGGQLTRWNPESEGTVLVRLPLSSSPDDLPRALCLDDGIPVGGKLS